MIKYFNNIARTLEAYLANFSFSLWNLGLTVETYKYPEKTSAVYGERYGNLRLLPKEDMNRHRCNVCFNCEKCCPSNAINLEIFPMAKGKNILLSFQHNLGYCTSCGLCVKSCDAGAIEFNGDFGISCRSKEELTVDILKRFREKPL